MCAHMLKSQVDSAVLWALSSGLLRRVGLLLITLRYIIATLAKIDMKAAWSICLPQECVGLYTVFEIAVTYYYYRYHNKDGQLPVIF